MIKWQSTKLAHVLKPTLRNEAINASKEYRLLGMRLDGAGAFHRETKLGSQCAANMLYQVKANDFVYSRLFAWRGAFGVIPKKFDEFYVSSEFPVFEPIDNKIDVRFLMYWFRLPTVLRNVEKDCSGSTPLTRNRYKESFFLALEIPLPPLDEQRRIVAHIEALAARVVEARGLRQQTVEEAEALLESYTDEVLVELTSRFELCKFSKICTTITDGDHITPQFSTEGVKFIFVGNVSSGLLHFNNCKYVTEEYFAKIRPQRIPKRGDILYSAVGATLGVPAIVDVDEPFCFQRHIAILKPDPNWLDSQFAWHLLQSGKVYRKAWSSTTGSAQPTIPLKAIRELEIPVPPIQEQHRIVAYLDDLHARVNALKRLQAETAAELDALLPAVLDRAFHLTP